jgi:H+/Cl- antiporter ClcA
MEWLTQFWESLTWGRILLGAVLIVVSFVVSTFIVSVIMVKIPANYFHSDYEHHFLTDKHPILRWTVIVIKNIVGVILILLGIVMMFPGVPGPGVLTVLIGLILIDLPGKRKIEALIINRPAILNAVNNLRTRYHKEPLLID